MKAKRILIVLPDPPLPFGNAASRWFYVLCKGLSGRGHSVTVFAACSKREDERQAHEFFPRPNYDLRCYAYPIRTAVQSKWETVRRPYSYVFSPELRHDLETEIARGYDVLHLEQLWTGWLGLPHLAGALLNIHYSPKLDSPEASGIREAILRRLSLRAEKKLLQRYRFITTLTPRLTEYVRSINAAAFVQTVPLGLDLSLYPFAAQPCCDAKPVVSLIGSFSWGPTYSAGIRLLTRLWPDIKKRVPEAQLQIVGRDARRVFQSFSTDDDIDIRENVPDTLPYFQRAGVLLFAPERASGMKVKVLEAMALGVPVVTTSEGIEGLPAQDGVHAAVCEDDEGLVARTVALLETSSDRLKLRQAARTLIESHCAPASTVAAVESVYDRIAKER